MEVILTQDVDKVGGFNEIIKVRPGYARNFLIPRGLALVANDVNKKMIADKIKQHQAKVEKQLAEIRSIAEQLNNTVVTVGAKSGTSGKIFGAVTPLQVADAIKKQKSIEIDRKKISFAEEVKNLGTYVANIELHKDIKVQVNVEVEAE
jgi:large subunit ribosomal protein L9